MWRKLQSALQLSPRQWWWFACAWTSLWHWDKCIRTEPYARWSGALFRNPPAERQADTPETTLTSIKELIRISEMAARNHLVTVNCLRRTLSQMELLAQQGIECNFHIGVRRAACGMEAHCWLSWRGRPINDSPENIASYKELGEVAPVIGLLLR